MNKIFCINLQLTLQQVKLIIHCKCMVYIPVQVCFVKLALSDPLCKVRSEEVEVYTWVLPVDEVKFCLLDQEHWQYLRYE